MNNNNDSDCGRSRRPVIQPDKVLPVKKRLKIRAASSISEEDAAFCKRAHPAGLQLYVKHGHKLLTVLFVFRLVRNKGESNNKQMWSTVNFDLMNCVAAHNRLLSVKHNIKLIL